jgi:two-component system cell cycle response regulator CtrA
MQVLLVEQEGLEAESNSKMLKSAGFTVTVASLGLKAVELCQTYRFDIIILKINYSDEKCYKFLKDLKVIKFCAPVFVISADICIDERLKIFQYGAADHVSKPYDDSELIARISALVRRTGRRSRSIVCTGKLTVDLGNKAAYANDKEILLSEKEYATLEILSIRKGEILSKEIIQRHIYKNEVAASLKTIYFFLWNLRNKLRVACDGEEYIESIYGAGYLLQDRDR